MKKRKIFSVLILLSALLGRSLYVWSFSLRGVSDAAIKLVLKPLQRRAFAKNMCYVSCIGHHLIIDSPLTYIPGVGDFICPGVFDSPDFEDLDELVILGYFGRAATCGRKLHLEAPILEAPIFANVGIQRLERGVFRGLKNLKRLIMFVDSCASIDKEIFKDLPNLESLEISVVHGCGFIDCRNCNYATERKIIRKAPVLQDSDRDLLSQFQDKFERAQLHTCNYWLTYMLSVEDYLGVLPNRWHLMSKEEIIDYFGISDDVRVLNNGMRWQSFDRKSTRWFYECIDKFSSLHFEIYCIRDLCIRLLSHD